MKKLEGRRCTLKIVTAHLSKLLVKHFGCLTPNILLSYEKQNANVVRTFSAKSYIELNFMYFAVFTFSNPF